MDEISSWIASNAVAIRTVDPRDRDFSDLEFLADVIGDARVVQLGEASHSGGNGFAAKARLVEFLHERLGFEVLVWEESIYDMRLAYEELRGPEDVVTVVERAIRSDWSASAELRPLFDFVKARLSSTNPLEFAGYDARFGDHGVEHVTTEVRSFAAALPDQAARARALGLVEDALGLYDRVGRDAQTGRELTEDVLDDLRRKFDLVLADIDAHRDLFESAHGVRGTAFMERVIESLRTDGAGRAYLAQAFSGRPDAGSWFGRFWHARDEQGARNLRWLIEEEYRGRKVMFWAHNVHVMNAYCGEMFAEIRLDPQDGDMKPTGVFVADWFGDDVYTIGMTHYEGEVGSPGQESTPLTPAAPDSLEARMHALGEAYLFLDLRATDATPSHPMRTEQSVRIILPNVATLPDVTRAFDGILHLDRVTRATRVPE